MAAGSAWGQVQTQQLEQLTGHRNNRHGSTAQQQQQHQQQMADSVVLPGGLGEQQQQQQEDGATPGFGPGGAGSQWLQAVNMAALSEAEMREQQHLQQKENGLQQTHDSWTDGHAQAMVCLTMLLYAPALEFAIIAACYTCCIMC